MNKSDTLNKLDAIATERLFGVRPWLVNNSRCRLHGGWSPGAKRGAENGNFKSGDWTAEAIEERKWLRSLIQSFAQTDTKR